MNYTLYDPATGQITELFSMSDADTPSVTLKNTPHVPGWFDPSLYYIENQQPVAKSAQPSKNHVWNYELKAWQLDLVNMAVQQRNQRDILLQQIDKVNPIWFNTLSVDQQQQLQAYRQALLDVPQQAGFPTQVEWPAKPQWL